MQYVNQQKMEYYYESVAKISELREKQALLDNEQQEYNKMIISSTKAGMASSSESNEAKTVQEEEKATDD